MNEGRKLYKKGKAPYIAPLRPPTLAAFQPWGDSEGAGRVRLSPTRIYYFSLKLSKMNGRMSSTLENFQTLSVPNIMTLIGFPLRV